MSSNPVDDELRQLLQDIALVKQSISKVLPGYEAFVLGEKLHKLKKNLHVKLSDPVLERVYGERQEMIEQLQLLHSESYMLDHTPVGTTEDMGRWGKRTNEVYGQIAEMRRKEQDFMEQFRNSEAYESI